MTTSSPPPPYNPLQSDYDLLTAPEPEPETETETDSSSIEAQKPNPTILHLAFNQDHSCFTAATDSSFRVYTCDPLRRCDSDSTGPRGGVGLVQMLFHSNYFAVVGGGPDPFSPPNKVMIWDDRLSRCIGHLGFRSDVRGVRIRRDRIVVVLLNKVAVYNFDNLKPFDEMMTLDNPKGLCEVSTKSGPAVVACPGLHPGQVRVHHYGSKRTKFIMAHCSDLASFTLTQDGRFLATASSKGTLVRVFNTLDGTLLQEVRRGADRAEIYSLAFSSTAQWLAVSSDKGTVHVFSVKIDSGASGNDNSGSTSEDGVKNPSGLLSLPYLKAVLPSYFSSEWSVAKFRLEEGIKHLVAFGHQKHTVVILGMNGSFYRCQFDPVNGGEMTQLEHSNFLQPE